MSTETSSALPSDGAATNGATSSNSNENHMHDAEVAEGSDLSSPKKRMRANGQDAESTEGPAKRVKGVAPIKAESASPTLLD